MASHAQHRKPPCLTRPEEQGAPSAFYDGSEAARYDSCHETRAKQAQLTRRALELLGLPAGRAALVLDVGCGSALSGEVIAQAAHHWFGVDASAAMLQLAADKIQHRHSTDSNGATHDQDSSDTMHSRNSSDCGCSACGDAACWDMGHGLPCRPGVFDAALSISAVQWLIFAPQPAQALRRFFGALHAVLVPGAPVVLQVYVCSAEEANVLLAAACAAAFGQVLLLSDYTHRTAAKKLYLCMMKPSSSMDNVQQTTSREQGQQSEIEQEGEHRPLTNSMASTSAAEAPECGLSGHIGGTCMLWWRLHHGQPLAASHGGQALDAYAVQMHDKHNKKLLRLLIGAAARQGLLRTVEQEWLRRVQGPAYEQQPQPPAPPQQQQNQEQKQGHARAQPPPTQQQHKRRRQQEVEQRPSCQGPQVYKVHLSVSSPANACSGSWLMCLQGTHVAMHAAGLVAGPCADAAQLGAQVHQRLAQQLRDCVRVQQVQGQPVQDALKQVGQPAAAPGQLYTGAELEEVCSSQTPAANTPLPSSKQQLEPVNAAGTGSLQSGAPGSAGANSAALMPASCLCSTHCMASPLFPATIVLCICAPSSMLAAALQAALAAVQGARTSVHALHVLLSDSGLGYTLLGCYPVVRGATHTEVAVQLHKLAQGGLPEHHMARQT